MQNKSNILAPLVIVGNSRSIFFSPIPWGKKATTPSSSWAFRPSSLNTGDARDGSIVATATATNGPKQGQSGVPNQTAMIWGVSGDCSLKAHGQTMFKGPRTGEPAANSMEEFDDRNIHVRIPHWAPVGWAANATGESKPRGQPSLIATIIYADTRSTWTTYEDLSPK